MIIIADTNIIISACLDARSELFQILTATYTDLDFITPEYALAEIDQHKTEICFKTSKSIVLFQNNLNVLLDHIIILPDEDVSDSYIKEAELLTATIDIDDTIFVAFSMALDSLIWTGDLKLVRRLRKSGFNNIIVTKELKRILKGL